MPSLLTASQQKNIEITSFFARLRPRTPPAPTLCDVTRMWLEAARPTLKRSTLSTYTRVAETHIYPGLGDRPIGRLTAENVAALLYSKSYGPSPLSTATVRCIVSVLRGAVEYAGRHGLCPLSPSVIRAPALNGRSGRTLDAEAQSRLEAHLLSHAEGPELGILICMYTGLRIGEVCALKWGDVAPDGSCLTVSRTLQRIRALDAQPGEARTMLVFDAPKSRSANRSIPLPPFLAELLRAKAQSPERFVLTGEAGRAMEPRGLQNRFKAVLRACGVADINFHALRHTFATRCVELGFDIKTLSEIMGHSDVSVTLNTYIHPSMEQMRTMMGRLESRGG